jgi:cell wall-associated NlpC family hydrolase
MPSDERRPAVGLIQTLQNAGFSGPALQQAWAIASRESGGNPNAFNGNASTGDKSYGLFQINMLGGLGPARMRQYGLKNEQDLFNPVVNARVAYAMSKGGKDFGAWGIGPNAYKGAPPAALKRYQQLLGQFPGGASGGASGAGTSLGGPLRAAQGGGDGVGTGGARKAALMALIQSNNDFITGQEPTVDPMQTLQMLRKVTQQQPGEQGNASLSLGGGLKIKGVNPADPADVKAVTLAKQALGIPYVWGGTGKSGFDCSGLLQYVWGKSGVNIPRTTYDQFKVGTPVATRALRPGDAVFFKGSDSMNGLPGHVGLYIGNGKFIEAPHTGASVQISTLAGYPGYMGARRYG